MDDKEENLGKLAERIEATPIKKIGRLGFAYVRLTVLMDYIKVINNNGEQLVTPASKEAITTGQEPAIQLYDYLILEVCSFYDYVKELKKKNFNLSFPDLPDYLGKIYTFRSVVVAHLDKHERLKDGKDFINAYQPVFRDIGVAKILADLEAYFDEVKKLFNES